MHSPTLPTAPPLMTADLPGTGGHIAEEPEAFQVDELPLYTPSGAGEHHYVLLRKHGWTTPDAVRALARACGVHERDIGTAGLKDRNAITTQWISLPGKARLEPPPNLPDGLHLDTITRHGNKLRTGHLLGNRFRIRVEALDAPDAAAALADRLARDGVWNAFGLQRFGRGAANLDRALRWLQNPDADRGRARLHRKLYPSVLQSEVFTRYLHLRIAAGLEAPLPGEIVRLANTGSHFRVEDPDAELQRWQDRDILPTGPMFGPRGLQAEGPAAALEQQAIAESGLGPDLVERLAPFAPGARRDLRIPLDDLELTGDGNTLTLAFSLPAGGYATLVVREFTRTPWLPEPDADPAPTE